MPGRRWQDDGHGALLFTLVLERRRINTDYPLTQCLALALCSWLEGYSIKSSIKWPNDVRIDRRKIAGILVETVDDYFLAGLGVNIRKMNLGPVLEKEITSLQECLSADWLEQVHKKPDNQHLTDLLCLIEITLKKPPSISQVAARLEFQGCPIRIDAGSGANRQSFRGILKGLAPDGALLLDTGEEYKAIYSGEMVNEEPFSPL